MLTSTGPFRGIPDWETALTADHGGGAAARPAAIRTSARAIYRYSVIRGGAYSAAELEAALQGDAVAAEHYAVFDRRQLHMAPAHDPAAVYVSYRQGDRVFWTRRKVRLQAEEILLTDGVHTARARCGNRISPTPEQPVQAEEPGISDLDVAEPAQAADRAPGAFLPPEDFPPPLLVHEVFPPPAGTGAQGGIASGLPGYTPGGGPGWPGGGGSGAGAGSGGGIPGAWPPAGQNDPPVLPGWALMPPPNILLLPSPPFNLPPQQVAIGPVGGGTWWPTPVPPPGVYGGLPPSSWTMPGLPPVVLNWPGMTGPGGYPTGGLPGIPGTPGPAPGPTTTSGSSIPPTTSSQPTPGDGPPPGIPPASGTDVPEPATAALVLCSAAIVAQCRLLFRMLR